jgi:hypothetical protein
MPDLNLVGYDAVLSWSATVADPASSAAGLAAIDNARDVNVTISVDKVDMSDRASRFKTYCPAMLEVEVTAEVTYNATTKAFINKCLDRDVMTIAVLDSVSGSGLYFTGQCFTSDLNVPLTDGLTINLSFAPTKQSGSGAGGAPVWA